MRALMAGEFARGRVPLAHEHRRAAADRVVDDRADRGATARSPTWSAPASTSPPRAAGARSAAAEARLRHMADHDDLTGLYNRRRFEEELERHIAHGARYGMSGALLMLDLDDFKRINDGHGHRRRPQADRRGGGAAQPAARERHRRPLRRRRVRGPDAGRRSARGRGAGRHARRRRAPRRADPAGPLSASVGIALFEESTTADEILPGRRRDVRGQADGPAGDAASRGRWSRPPRRPTPCTPRA